MRLSDLDSKNFTPNILLIQTSCTKLQMFVEDKLKSKYNITSEAIVDIETKSDYKKIKEIIGTIPPFSDKWYVQVDLDKHNNKELINMIKQVDTALFFCTCSSYRTYKDFKGKFGEEYEFYDLYLNFLRKPDFIYLYDLYVGEDNKLSSEMLNYCIKSYSGDLDSVFKLLESLQAGMEFKTRTDIADVCGIGGLSVESIIFDLLKPLSGSAKGLDRVFKNRLKACKELGESLGYSSFYNFMSRSLKLFCELKMLIISGVVYKKVRNLPDSFDEKALARYQKYIWRLKEIPMSELLRLRYCMGKKTWKSDIDMLNFIYNYFYMQTSRLVVKEDLKNGNNM